MKKCTLDLWDQDWTIEDICDMLGVSHASLYCWDGIYKEHGNVIRPPSPLIGCTQIISRAVLRTIHALHELKPDLYLDELCMFLAVEHNLIVSKSTLSCNLAQAGFTYKILYKIAVKHNEWLRDECKESLRDRTKFQGDGSEFVCVGETSKNKRAYAQLHGWSFSGQPATLSDVFVWGDRYLLVAAITIEGYIVTRVVPSSLDSFEFYNFIAEDVVSFTPLLYTRS